MRLFVSLPLPEAVRRHVGGVVGNLSGAREPELRDVRWVRPGNLHVTLKFLGEVPEPDVSQVAAALDGVTRPGPIVLRATGLGFQPKRGPVHLIACEFDGDLEAVRRLHAGIEEALAKLGFARDQRAFWCHATLGRARRAIDIPSQGELAFSSNTRWPGPDGEVSSFELMSSALRPEAPLYVPVATYPLARTAG